MLAVACALIYYAVFSSFRSKLFWYLLPSYPLVFVASGIGFASAMPGVVRPLRVGVLALLLLLNLGLVRDYDARRRTGVDIVDFLVFPFERVIRSHPLITQGNLHQNGLALTDIESDFQLARFAGGEGLDSMRRVRPDADYLITEDGRPYFARSDVRALRVLERPGDPRRPAIFEIAGRGP